MTPSVDDAADRIDEGPVLEAAVHELAQPLHVVPPAGIVLLDAFHPVEHARDPLELLELGARAYRLGILAEVYFAVRGLPSLSGSTFAQVVVQFTEVTAKEVNVHNL